MLRQEDIDRIAEEIIGQIQADCRKTVDGKESRTVSATAVSGADVTAKERNNRGRLGADTPKDDISGRISDTEAFDRMKARTTARIGVGKAGPRLRTETMLKLRADHAAARDAVLMGVDKELVKSNGLFSVTTKCPDKDTFLTRPDLGRDFDEETQIKLMDHCIHKPDVQLIVSDGLSSSSVEANAFRLLPVVMEGLKEKGISVGTPIFVEHGRVGAQDRISELLGAKVVCSFIGERPGLATAESLSAYISYMATVGMPEARRTVVSNIHKDGVPAVEAGAYVVDLIALILEKQASGVELQK